MMPKSPCLYSVDAKYSDEDLKSLLFRFTVGEEPFLMSIEEIKKIARGEIKVSQEFVADINEKMNKTFSFNVWKIPVVHVSTDEYVFTNAWTIYEGRELHKAQSLEQELTLALETKKKKLLDEAKERIKQYPDYLSIVRKLIQSKISFEEAINEAGPASGIIVKGI